MTEVNTKKKKSVFKRWWFWVVIILLIIIIKVSTGGSGNSTTPVNKPTSGQSTQVEGKKYTYEKFLKVSMGMTYDQVKAILGDGTEESSTGDGADKTVSYTWKNDDAGNISVMIQGSKVINKAQAGLQGMDAKVTMEKYNKVKNGMTYDQVKAVLGEGQLSSESELLGTKDQIYEWINSDGANMNVTFQGGKVDTKAQFELK